MAGDYRERHVGVLVSLGSGFEPAVDRVVLRSAGKIAGLHFEEVDGAGLQAIQPEVVREVALRADLEPVRDDRVEEVDVAVVAQSNPAGSAGSGTLQGVGIQLDDLFIWLGLLGSAADCFAVRPAILSRRQASPDHCRAGRHLSDLDAGRLPGFVDVRDARATSGE